MKKIHVSLSDRSYDIHIAEGLLQQSGELIRSVYQGKKAALVSDENVWFLYGTALTQSLAQAGIKISPLILPPGEGSKSLTALAQVLAGFADNALQRNDLVIAFGGGVIGDLAGFAAAIYMRGIPYVQIPTTLLAQVDSSVGGKTAVNLPQGKNLAGAFWQPRQVIIDPALLQTLPPRQLSSGMAEVIKYGAIVSKPLFTKLQRYDSMQVALSDMAEVISICCESKRCLVEKDERDSGERMLLNFGHTFGHAIEKIGGYRAYTHGEAVAMGMALAAKVGEMAGVTSSGVAEELAGLLKAYALPAEGKVAISQIASLIALDKKNNQNGLQLVLLKNIGESFIYPINMAACQALLSELA